MDNNNHNTREQQQQSQQVSIYYWPEFDPALKVDFGIKNNNNIKNKEENRRKNISSITEHLRQS